MEILDDLSKASLRQETILTIGAFDGVHRGHQMLIGQVVTRARKTDRLSALITFHPHPAAVLAPDRAPPYLTTPGEKVALLVKLGLDLLVLLPFTRETAATSARDFMEAVSHHLRLRELWIGADFALGHNREGNVTRLRELGGEMGYQVHVIEPVTGGDEIISSSRIRALLRDGNVAKAARLLGRYPSLSGEVVTGAQRGHKLGFPTANLKVRPERAVPADGIYAVFAWLGEERHPAVANVGVRPSFDNGERTVEAYIFDFDRDIYGCDLVVEFVARLRDELRFESIDALIAQIERDAEEARQILAQTPRVPSPSVQIPRGRTEVGCRYRFHEIDHTADRALKVWAADLPDLYVGAAKGMYSLMGDLHEEGQVATQWREVSLEAMDRETLLVDWLNELLFLAEAEGLLFVDFQIRSLTETTLEARAGGIHAPVSKANIKAATFHDLAFVRDDSGWSIVITFDV
jgi:riboflavin kinase/FMN adenylyltransferase